MVLLIDTTNEHIGGVLEEELSERGVTDRELVDVNELRILPCIGCNHCWLKTPGICSLKDDYEPVLRKIKDAEKVWLIADTRFGFVSYKAKNIIDRLMPLVTMHLHFRNGEMRHVRRYPNPLMIGLIYTGDGDQAYLSRWCERTAINFGGHSLGVYRADSIGEAVACMHVMIINGSPRNANDSNTEKILTAVVRGMERKGVTTERYCISKRKTWEEIREAYRRNEEILIGLPLFVECVPGLLLEFLETLPRKDERTRISFLLQGGFAEACQLRCGEAFLQKLPGYLGVRYGGCLIKGDNFGIRLSDEATVDKLTKPYEAMGEFFAKGEGFFGDEVTRFAGPERLSLPKRLLYGAIFRTIGRRLFPKVAARWGCTVPLDDRPWT